jgi:hypothetical protein
MRLATVKGPLCGFCDIRSLDFGGTFTDAMGLTNGFDSVPSADQKNKLKIRWRKVSGALKCLFTLSISMQRWGRLIERSQLRYIRDFSCDVLCFGQIFSLFSATI